MRVENKGKRGRSERQILTGMVIDAGVLGHLAPIVSRDNSPFRSKWSNMIAGWCVDYYKQYGKPPGRAIESMFHTYAEKSSDEDTVKILEKFLQHLSDEFERDDKFNSAYIVDLAGGHLNSIRLDRLKDSIEAGLSSGNVEKVMQEVASFHKLEVGQGSIIDVLEDKEALKQAFNQEDMDVLVKYKGALGKFFGPAFTRDSFISYMGPEKRGKSFWLLDAVWIALTQRCRVAYFVVGDMSQNQVMRRLAVRAAGRPMSAKTFWVPETVYRKGKDIKVKRKKVSVKGNLEWKEVWRAFKKTLKFDARRSPLRMSCHPASSLTASEMDGIIKGWGREGWVPDVVVVDYADILAPEKSSQDPRDQINETWIRLRAMSQVYHCLVLTATQTDATSYGADLLGRKHFTNDKRKFAHVNGMVGLNQRVDEEKVGLIRLNWVVPLRDSPRDVEHVVHVAECRELAFPSMRVLGKS